MGSDNQTTLEQATQTLATFSNRNGWPPETADAWVTELEDAHGYLLGWDVEDLYKLARKIAASKLPNSNKAALYVQSLTGSNVQSVFEQATEKAAQTIEDTTKSTAKTSALLLPVALLGALWLASKSKD